MAGQVTLRSSIFVLLVATTACVVASTIPKRMKVTPLRDYFEDNSNPEESYGFVAGYPLRQTRRGLDSLSGATFGESKRFVPREINPTMVRPSFDEIERISTDHFGKRNIDEIDRTAFDSFLKRNFDEIDRVGWSGFVKRLDNYLRERQSR